MSSAPLPRMSVACGMSIQNHALDIDHALGRYALAFVVPAPAAGAGTATQGLARSFGQKWEEMLASMGASGAPGESDMPELRPAERLAGVAPPIKLTAASPSRPVDSIGQDSQHASESFSNAGRPIGSIASSRRIVRTLDANTNPGSRTDRQEGMGKAAKVVANGSHPQKITTKGEKTSIGQETISPEPTGHTAVSEFMLSAANAFSSQSRTGDQQGHPPLGEPLIPNVSIENAEASRTSDLKTGASPLQAIGGRQTSAAEIEIQSGTPDNDSAASPVISSSPPLPLDAIDASSSTHRAIATFGETGLPVPALHEKEDASLLHPGVADPSASTVQAGSLTDRHSLSHAYFERKTAGEPSVTEATKRTGAQPDPITDRDTPPTSHAAAGPVLVAAHAGSPLRTMPASTGVHEEHSFAGYGADIAPQPAIGTSTAQIQQSERLREPFAAMDAAAAGPASQWTIAGRHRAEAGFQDPSLGWVSVRAQEGGGGIHAAVVPASDIAAQVLSTHLAGLNAHVASQYEHLSPVTLSSPDSALNNQTFGQHAAQRDGRDTSESGRQQGQDDSQPHRTDAVLRTSSRFVEVESGNMETPAITTGQNPGEQHVSVIV